MLSLRIAWRFLLTSRAQTILISTGIAIGVAVTIFIGSLIASLQDFLIEQTLGSSPHLTLTAKKDGDLVRYTKARRKKIRDYPEITTILPVRTISSLYRRGPESAGLVVKSGQPGALNALYKLRDKLTAGRYRLQDDRIIVGQDFANDFDLKVGDELVLILPNGDAATRTVSGVLDLGVGALNERLAFTGAGFGAEALGYGADEFNGIELQLSDVFASSEIARALEKSNEDIKIADWQVEQESLLSGLQAQSSSTLMIQVFVVIAIALGIASTLSISALQKTRQIGILKAMGMDDGRSGRIFLWQGLLLGLAGTTGGVWLGLGLIRLFQYISSRAPSPLFPIEAQADFIAAAWGIGLGVAAISAALPSRRTSRLDPIEVIQGG